MPRRSVFVSSWFFAPYAGSANVDLLKRLRHVDLDFDVVQVKGRLPDDSLMKAPCRARFRRHELDLGDLHPRDSRARSAFIQHGLGLFDPQRHVAILSHSNEVPSHSLAYQLKLRHPDIPWVAYFGDVVSRNPYVRLMRDYPLFDEDCRTEDLTLRFADLVICNNEVQAALMAQTVPDEVRATIVVIPHAWEEAFAPTFVAAPNDRFVFMHLGELYAVRRTARPVLEAVDLLIETYPDLARRFEVLFVGDHVDDADLVCWKHLRNAHAVRFLPAVRYRASLELMRHADALVLIDGVFSPDEGVPRSPFFPGKLVDYLGARKPVLAVTMNEGPSASLLNPLGQPCVAPSPQAIAYQMKRILTGDVSSSLVPPSLRAERVGAEMELALTCAIDRRPGAFEMLRSTLPLCK